MNCREEGMVETRSFHEILLEKMQKKPHFASETPRTSSHFSSVNTYESLLFSRPYRFNAHPSFDKTAYKTSGNNGQENYSVKTTFRAKKPTPTPTPDKTVLIKDLNKEQLLALENWIHRGAKELKGLKILSESSLKRSFRQWARQLHPDVQGGSNKEFRALHNDYKILSKAFAQQTNG